MKMNYKKQGRITGIAFIIATAAGIASLSFIDVLNKANYLNEIAKNPNSLIIGAILVAIMGFACASIAYSIYPVLATHSKGLAIGAIGFRSIEAAMTLCTAATMLALVPIAQSIKEGSDAAGLAINSLQDGFSFMLAIAFIAGAMLYNIGFLKAGLVPRWLSIWGIVALLMHLFQQSLSLFGMDSFSTASIILNLPIALQEMVMAIWLIIFGFKKAEVL